MTTVATPREVAALWPKNVAIHLRLSEAQAIELFDEVQEAMRMGFDEHGDFTLGTQLLIAIQQACYEAGLEYPAYAGMVSGNTPTLGLVRIGPDNG